MHLLIEQATQLQVSLEAIASCSRSRDGAIFVATERPEYSAGTFPSNEREDAR
jgi:hypothetical protein